MDTIQFQFEIEKSADSGRLASGWIYVHKDKNGQVVDYSGDIIDDINVLREGAHDFMEQRVAKSMHGKGPILSNDGKPIGDIVDSLIIDDDVAKALGMTSKMRGWWGTIRINDPEIQKAVKDGKLKQFSFAGRCAVQDLAA